MPADRAEPAVVGQRPATYVRGAWRHDDTWDAALDSAILSWEAEGITYVIQFSGLGLSRNDLVRIAESLR